VSYRHLLKTQANDVLNAVLENGLNPEDFAWDFDETPTLRHRQFEDYFSPLDPIFSDDTKLTIALAKLPPTATGLVTTGSHSFRWLRNGLPI
jgi:hypothetical protein